MIRPNYPRLTLTSAGVAVQAAGNSLTASVGASAPSAYWPAVAAATNPLLSAGISIVNRGVGGMSISVDAGSGTLIAAGASAIDANLVAGKVNVLMVFEYTNELKPNGNNAAAAHAAMQTYCLARRAAAASAGKQLRIIVGTAPPAGADPLVNGSTMQGRIDARNAALIECNRLTRANFRGYADVLWDIAALEPFATIFANGDFRQSVFAATGAWARSDAVADDYTHFGDPMYRTLGLSGNRQILRVPK